MISIYYPMPDKNKTNLGLAPVFLLIQRCARCLPYSINALTRLVWHEGRSNQRFAKLYAGA